MNADGKVRKFPAERQFNRLLLPAAAKHPVQLHQALTGERNGHDFDSDGMEELERQARLQIIFRHSMFFAFH
jgi:hypothetical protein